MKHSKTVSGDFPNPTPPRYEKWEGYRYPGVSWRQCPRSIIAERGYKEEPPAGAVLPYNNDGYLTKELINSTPFDTIHVDGIHDKIGNRIVILELSRFGPIVAMCRPWWVNVIDKQTGGTRKKTVQS